MNSNENAALRIIDIARITWNEGEFQVSPRPFSGLAFRIKGSAVIESGEKTYEIHKNDLLYLPQGTGYKAKYTDTDLIAIHFVTARQEDEISVHTLRDPEEFRLLFEKAKEIWEKKEPGYATFAMAQLYQILGTLEEQETRTNLPKHFLKALSFINENFTDPDISAAVICSRAGISATVFRQLFKKHQGQTPTEYITKLRLEYARKLISGGASVERAACESGFSDPKYFSRVVKKHFGCTPKGLKYYGK